MKMKIKKFEASCDAKINNQPTVTLVVTSVRPATVNHLPTVYSVQQPPTEEQSVLNPTHSK